MSHLVTVRGHAPTLGPATRVLPTAVIVGDVVCGRGCSFWFHSVTRGDVGAIRLGDAVNVQDGAVLHCTYERTDLRVGDRVSIGHRAIVHGCTVGDDVLIGMGAIVMDRAVVEPGCLVGAGALVPEGAVCESGWVYAGVPARPLKRLTPGKLRDEVARIAAAYGTYAAWYEET